MTDVTVLMVFTHFSKISVAGAQDGHHGLHWCLLCLCLRQILGPILSHISLDLISGLPPFCGNTVILSIMDRCQALGAMANPSSGYHQQTNGQTERVNRDLEAALLCVCLHRPTSWSTRLPWLGYAHNTLILSTTGRSCFLSAYGYQQLLFPSQDGQVEIPSTTAPSTMGPPCLEGDQNCPVTHCIT